MLILGLSRLAWIFIFDRIFIRSVVEERTLCIIAFLQSPTPALLTKPQKKSSPELLAMEHSYVSFSIFGQSESLINDTRKTQCLSRGQYRFFCVTSGEFMDNLVGKMVQQVMNKERGSEFILTHLPSYLLWCRSSYFFCSVQLCSTQSHSIFISTWNRAQGNKIRSWNNLFRR